MPCEPEFIRQTLNTVFLQLSNKALNSIVRILTYLNMKNLLVFILLFLNFSLFSQITMPAAGGNKKASVSEWIGITQVTIAYNRPGVNGREGKIWGNLVHYGFKDLNYGTSKAAPWRAGANENTTVEFSTEVSIESKLLPAGKYGFFIAMGDEKATLVFSRFNTAWGSFYYDPKDDALRVDVPIKKSTENVERLKYEFTQQTETSAVIELQWEKIRIPFNVSVGLQKLQIESFRREFNSGQFYQYWQNMHTAASYCLVNNINLEEGLSWADRSINTYFGETNFLTLSTYAGLLEKFNRTREADSLMQKAFPMATPLQLLLYGSNLNKMKQHKKAFDFFKMSYDKNPNENFSLLGMGMGYYFLENKKEAIQFAEKGKATATENNWKSYFDSIINDLNAGKEMFK